MATPSPSPLANATNILPPPPEDNTLGALSQALAVTFFIMGLGYFSGVTGFVPRTANKGIGPLIGKVCLPLLIFRSVAKLDLSSVEWGIVGCCAMVKVCCFCLGAVLACLTRRTGADARPGDSATQIGIFGGFCINSNDFALGLAVIQSLYPPSSTPGVDLPALTFVVVGVHLCVTNIPGFVFLEMGKTFRLNAVAKAKKGGSSASVTGCGMAKIVGFSLAKNPLIISTFVGLVYALARPVVPDDTTEHKNIPPLLDKMLKTGGSAFTMSALFLGGMGVVGKFGLLRGKRLVLPMSLSLIKVLVAPVLGFFVTRAMYEGHVHGDLFSRYVFIYSSMPTAGSIVVFAQAYDFHLQDMISGAALLVTIVFVPIMFTVSTLLVGGNLGETGISDICQVVSILGCLILLLLGILSPDWKTWPKNTVIQVALTGLFFGISHLGCYNSLVMQDTGWGGAHIAWAGMTYFARLWRRLLIPMGLGIDLLLIHRKGAAFAAKVSKWKSVALIIIAMASTITFFASGQGQSPSRYPCWYNFGPPQINYDFVLMSIELCVCSVILGVVYATEPLPAPVEPEKSFSKNSWKSSTSFKSLTDTVSTDESSDTSAALGLPPTNPYKCGITGGYVYRTRLVIAIHWGSLVLSLLANRTALKAAQGGMIQSDMAMSQTDPILAFIQILTIIFIDGKGCIVALAYMTMRNNGWLAFKRNLKLWYRKLLISVEVNRGHTRSSAERIVTDIPAMYEQLVCTILSVPDLVINRRYRLRVFKKCVPGNKLLDYMVEHKLARTRQEALAIGEELFDLGLIHHVCHDHEFKDAPYFYNVLPLYAPVEESDRREVELAQGR